jgi:hypothetical protein
MVSNDMYNCSYASYISLLTSTKSRIFLVLGMCSCCVVFFRTEFKKCRGVKVGKSICRGYSGNK